MNQQELIYFMRAAELNNISKVAQENNITPSSVSAHISRLESELGVNLFDRNGKSVKLNNNGEIVYHHILSINNYMADAKRELCDTNHDLNYGITISSLTIPRVIPHIIRGFREKHPSIRLTISQYQKKREITNMNCDVMLYSTNDISNTENSRTIYEEPILLLASRQHRLAGLKIVTVDDIVNEQFIRASNIADFGQLTTRILTQLGISPEIAIVSDYPEFVMEFISSNNGISFQPGLTYQFYYRNQNIVPVFIQNFSPVRYINIAWDNNRYYSNAAQMFIDYVCSYLKSLPDQNIPGKYIGD